MSSDNLVFQIVDWYGTDCFDDDDDAEYRLAHSYDVNIFGRTEKGESVALQVTGFHPYFYIKVPDDWTYTHVRKFKDFIIRKKRFLVNTLVDIHLVEKYPFQGFTNRTKSKFIHLVFKTRQAMNSCRYIFQSMNRCKLHPDDPNNDEVEIEVSPKAIRVPGLTRNAFVFQLFESNIDPMIRLGHKQGLQPSGWLHVQHYSDHNINETNCDIAISCDWNDLAPWKEKKEAIGPIRVCAFDIECTSSHGDFPRAKKDYETPAREIVMDLQRLTSNRRTVRDDWAYRRVMDTTTKDSHRHLLTSYINHIFGLPNITDDHDTSRIHTVNTQDNQKPKQESIQKAIDELMDIFDTEKLLITKPNANSKTKVQSRSTTKVQQKSLNSFIVQKKEKTRISDIFLNCQQKYAKEGVMYGNKVRNLIIKEVTKILNQFFPAIEGDAIVQVSNVFTNYGDETSVEKILYTVGKCADIPDCTVIQCATERDLLVQWTKMIQYKDPDIIAGYNSYGFDLPYMYNRAEQLGILSRFAKLSKLSDHQSVMKKKRLASAALGDNIWYDVPIIGRIHVDIMRVVQRDFNLSSWKLDYVASFFMNGKIKGLELCETDSDIDDADAPLPTEYRITTDNTKGLAKGSFVNIQINNGLTTDMYGGDHAKKFQVTDIGPTYLVIQGELNTEEVDFVKYKCNWCHAKDDMEYTAIFAAFNDKRDTPELIAQRAKVGQYCMKDSVLCIDLINKLDIIANNIGMSNVCSVPLSWIFSRGQGAKTLSLVSKQCAKDDFLIPVMYMKKGQDAEFEGAIVLKPEPGIYLDSAIATLDYASLYPSCIISENMSHDTIVLDDKWKGEEGGQRLRELGYDYIDIDWDVYKTIGTKKQRMRTETSRFVQLPNNEKGIIPRILQDLLRARKKTRKRIKYKTIRTKDGQEFTGLLSKKDGSVIITIGDGTQHEVDETLVESTATTHSAFQQGILDGLQKAYKITANSIYGQMGARTSPVKMIPIAASTTATGRSLLLLARDKIKDEYAQKTLTLPNGQSIFVKSAKTIYGDTDSVFVRFSIYDKKGGKKLVGKELLYAAIQCGIHSSKYATQFLKAPHDLEYEKAFYPFILLSKKRYVGMKYEFSVDKCKQTSMGIVLKRRDNAKILKFVFGGAIDIIMKERNVKKAFQFVQDTVKEIIDGKYGMNYLIITKSLRSGYKNPESIAHKVLADRIGDRDPGNRPQSNDRIPYVYITKTSKKGEKILQGDRIETPSFIRKNNLDIDYQFYITNQISKPVSQVFALIIEQLPNYRLQKKTIQLHNQLRKATRDIEKTLIHKRIRAANEKYAAELLFSDALRQIKNTRKGQKEITHFMNVVVPSG